MANVVISQDKVLSAPSPTSTWVQALCVCVHALDKSSRYTSLLYYWSRGEYCGLFCFEFSLNKVEESLNVFLMSM